MKKTKNFLITVVFAMMCSLSYAQTNLPDYMKAPKPSEKVIEIVSSTVAIENVGNEELLSRSIYSIILKKAKEDHPLALVDIREMTYNFTNKKTYKYLPPDYLYTVTAKVVDVSDPIARSNETLSAAIEKSFRNVREGSRMAIDQVTVINGINKEETKDQLIDILLDKGYKVVAKEYLQKLYEEQQTQQSGIYNDKTTVQDNNFSAVGYFINVKVTETSVRVQVVNVSTGEYEGNATVNF